MSFFEKRPLSTILCILLGGFSLFTLIPSSIRIFVLIAVALLLLISFILHRKIGFLPFVSTIILLISFAFSFLYFDQFFPIYDRVTGPTVITGRVTDISYQESFGAMFTMKTKRINRLPFSSSKILVCFVPEKGQDLNFEINDEVLLYGEIEALASTDSGFDEKQYYEARGVQGIVRDADAVSFTKNTRFSLLKWISNIRETVQDYIMRASDKQTSGLLTALILGEKSALPGQIRLDFKRIGLSHVLAVSGMHLAILTAGLHKLLSLIGLDKKWRCLISMLFVVIYMGLTGFPVSVLRAGGMVLISNLLFLLAKTQDPFTNLMISASAICLISPYAVHDLSLLLSFFATVGVLVAVHIFEDVPYYISWWLKGLIAIFSSLLSSFFAIALTLPFSVFNFGRMSYIAPITTLIFSVLVEIFMYLGSIFLLIGAPKFLSFPITWLSDFIADLSAWFAKVPNVYIISDTLIIKILCVLFYTLLILFLIIRIEHRKTALALLLIPFISIFICGYLSTAQILKEDRIVYFSDTKKNEVLLAIQNETVTVTNLTNNTNAGRSYLLQQLDQENILSLDFLWIPQYTANLPKALSDMLSSIPIRHIYLPMPTNETEEGVYASTKQTLADFRCTFSKYEIGEAIANKDLRLYPVYRAPMEEGCRVILTLKLNEKYYTYISNGAIEERNTDLANYVMAVSDTVIFGCRGRSYTKDYYLEQSSPHTKTLIFATNDIYIAQDVYEDYKSRARLLYRPKRVVLTE